MCPRIFLRYVPLPAPPPSTRGRPLVLLFPTYAAPLLQHVAAAPLLLFCRNRLSSPLLSFSAPRLASLEIKPLPPQRNVTNTQSPTPFCTRHYALCTTPPLRGYFGFVRLVNNTSTVQLQCTVPSANDGRCSRCFRVLLTAERRAPQLLESSLIHTPSSSPPRTPLFLPSSRVIKWFPRSPPRALMYAT